MCSISCPRHCISMRLSTEGFYIPCVNAVECVQCGLCDAVCPMANRPAVVTKAPDFSKMVGAWSCDENVRRRSSSGGVVWEIAKALSEKGYELCGVRYNPSAIRAEHFIAATLDQFLPSVGSKYIQSYTADAFSRFERGRKYFVVGTPCQIYALRNWIKRFRREDDFILMDFWCHGVPSGHLWRSFLHRCIRNAGGGVRLTDVRATWRDKKRFGWSQSWCLTVIAKGKKIYESSVKEGCRFFRFFLSYTMQNKVCYSCPFNGYTSGADLRCGDFWGERYRGNLDGVSKLVFLTRRGQSVYQGLSHTCHFEEFSAEEMNPMQARIPRARGIFIWLLKLENGFVWACRWQWMLGCLSRIKQFAKRGLA